MKIDTTFLARVLGGSTSALQKDGESAFGGVLSTIADDAAGHAGTATSTPLEASDPKSAGKKTSDNDDEAAATGDDADAKGDQIATTLPDGSLLALVQSAAFQPQAIVATTTASPSDRTATKPATAPDLHVAAAAGTEPTARLVKATADPLVSDVKVETHLAPSNVPTSQAQSTTLAAVATPTVPALAQADKPQALDKSRSVADKSVAAKPAATAADAADPTGDTTLAPAAQADAKAGRSDAQAGSDPGKREASDGADQAIADAAGGVSSQPDPSLVLQQKPTLSAPARAVAEAVTSLAAQATHAATTATSGPARTMLLQLSPGGLGTVSVRLHLTGSTLDVSLTTSHASTASLLDHDRAALTSALGDRDYRLNSLVIQGGDVASAPGGSSASTDSSSNRSASQSMADQHNGASGRGGARDPAPRQPGSARDIASPAAADAGGDALFV